MGLKHLMADDEDKPQSSPDNGAEGSENTDTTPPPAEDATPETPDTPDDVEVPAASPDASVTSPDGQSTNPEAAEATPTSSASPAMRKKHRKKGDLELEHARVGFLGAGKMTESIVDGLIKSGIIPTKHIFVSAPSKKNLEHFKNLGCHASRRSMDIFARYDCDVVFLCFHGSVIKNCIKQGGSRPFPLCTNFIPNMKHPIYILSVISGVSLDAIKGCLLNPEHPERYVLEIHRIMVNTAVAFGLGICGIDVEPDSRKLTAPIRTLLSSIATLEHIPENQMDAACAIGGSGLAFAYYFINALADGAFKVGLTRPMAVKLAAKTAFCASQCLIQSGKHPAELRDDVMSPSGAASFGIHILDRAEVASGVIAAIEAAHRRAAEMSEAD